MIDLGNEKITIDGTTYVIDELKTVESNGDTLVFIGKNSLGTTTELRYTRTSGSDSETTIRDAVQNGQLWKQDQNIRSIYVYSQENLYKLQ